MKKILICGLGAVGLTYAVKIKNNCELKILVDKNRLTRFTQNKPIFNGQEQDFDYILPEEKFFPDLIIISTKSNGLHSAIQGIKNFVAPSVKIISLVNGITSEEKILQVYPNAGVLKSYFIGHSAVRTNNSVTQDGIGEIVIEYNADIIDIFNDLGINYSIADDIDYSMWLKYTLNLFSNQTSAILNMNFGELKRNKNFINFAKKIITEVKLIAEKRGINNLENLENDAISSLLKMSDSGRTSMLQDMQAKRPTEIDIFAGEIIKLGKMFHIPTPNNQVLYDLIKIKEEDNEYSIHSC